MRVGEGTDDEEHGDGEEEEDSRRVEGDARSPGGDFQLPPSSPLCCFSCARPKSPFSVLLAFAAAGGATGGETQQTSCNKAEQVAATKRTDSGAEDEGERSQEEARWTTRPNRNLQEGPTSQVRTREGEPGQVKGVSRWQNSLECLGRKKSIC